MKGLEMEIVKFIILVVAVSFIIFIVWKLLPTFSQFFALSLESLKRSMCEKIGWAGFIFGC
ncbi:MAG: hypothetical protein QXI09_02815 [Candidatus Aenigmatarchaeota archaeon]